MKKNSLTKSIDSQGKLLKIDQKVLKKKTKEVWKYNKTGKGRYVLRITSWPQKLSATP
tara:strand:+ start:2078 stop:2251 length:174 start_codon:yes stop_codon:yes gene_type:complete